MLVCETTGLKSAGADTTARRVGEVLWRLIPCCGFEVAKGELGAERLDEKVAEESELGPDVNAMVSEMEYDRDAGSYASYTLCVLSASSIFTINWHL